MLIPAGPMDQSELEKKPDVLVFQTESLEEPVQVIGRITVKLWASSSCVDTDFVAKLMDVYPDGRSMLIADGIIRGRFRRSLSREELLEPGAIYEFDIDLWSTAIIFNKGHRIKLHITSSNYPRFDINPNTGQDYHEGYEMKVAENTIYHDKNHPSHILLPIVPLERKDGR
ncbi:CocE/NonD family hydrolase [Candidatus Poribacteria bacterium]|nr:CocE/NonD family hydrolase [Candidatus Poribacteria bacterium]